MEEVVKVSKIIIISPW